MYSIRCQLNGLASSSISALPTELLAEIFHLCALSSVYQGDCATNNTIPSLSTESIRVPLTLSSVSRRWRALALSQSSLWSNICITPELVESLSNEANSPSTSRLNPTHIVTYLARSRQHPLNILIDGRDPDWDFSEPDVGIDFGTSTFETLFSSEHMGAAMELLLPHIHRWRHLTILADTWVPMHTALTLMNPTIIQFGAPQLRSLCLMRCNDYVSYSRRFQPQQLRDVEFLKPSSRRTGKARADLLPQLKHLSLRGVHVDWDTLSDVLLASRSGLSTLELASHSKEVRPSMSQFHKLLQSTPDLQTLSVIGTGPEGPGSENDSAHNYEPILLTRLQDVTVGYRTETGGRSLLHFLDAPNVTSFVLDDTSYPADPSDTNAGPILAYLGSKHCDGNEHHLEASTSTSIPAEGDKRRKRSICAFEPEPESDDETPRGAFPHLQRVVLRNVKSAFTPLASFFSSLSMVTELELSGMSMLSIHALVPYSTSAVDFPCPRLDTLTIRESEFNAEDLDFIVTRLSACRQARGAPSLLDLNFHVNPSRAGDISIISAAAASLSQSNVHIISDGEEELDEDDQALLMSEDEEEAFRPGGAFNDPLFDAYYADGIYTQ